MFKNLKIILNKINDLGPEEIKLYFSLNSYQLELLAKLSKSKKSLNAQELLNSKVKLSRAQKYRSIQKLLKKNLIKKNYNEYYLK